MTVNDFHALIKPAVDKIEEAGGTALIFNVEKEVEGSETRKSMVAVVGNKGDIICGLVEIIISTKIDPFALAMTVTQMRTERAAEEVTG